MTETQAKLGVIILNWNNYADTARCLTSLSNVSLEGVTIYSVDNGSTDDSWGKIRAKFRQLSYRHRLCFISNEANLGFAAGCNRGIQVAMRDGCDPILLLNNDCIVPVNNGFEHAINLLLNRSDAGIIGGKIMFWPDSSIIWSTGGYIKALGGEKHIGHGEVDVNQYSNVEERSFISGALMLVKRRVFETIGLLPDVYFFGKEEWEFSTKTIKAGYKLLYCPDFIVFHEASHSHDWKDPAYIYNGTLSKILYKKRNHGKMFFLLWVSMYALYLRLFFYLMARLRSGKMLRGVRTSEIRRAMLAALNDYKGIKKIDETVLDNFRTRSRHT